MTIRKLRTQDFEQVAKIHKNFLKNGALPQLGQPFLKGFYKVLAKQNNIITYVAVQNNKVVGFATCGTMLENLPILILKNLWIEILVALLRNPFLFFKLIQLPFYPSFKPTDQRFGEILTLVVTPESRGKGIGKELIIQCRKELKNLDCQYFVASVRENMQDANNFYRKIGLKKIRTSKFQREDFVFWRGEL